jgi:signal transduction histidine kinase
LVEISVVVERVLERARLISDRDRYQREIERLNLSLEAEVASQTQDLWIQNRELRALNKVSYAISSPLDLGAMLDRALAAAIDAIEADAGVVRLLNPKTKELVVAVGRGFWESCSISAEPIPLGEGSIGQVAETGHPHISKDLTSDPWLDSLISENAPQDKAEGIRSYLCVPLRSGKETVGTMGVVTLAKHDFGTREIELMTTIGNQIGVAVVRAHYAADLQEANVQLEQANTNLRQLDTLREQFIQNVTHELRTPLALVHGYVEMLAQGGLSPVEQRQSIDVALQRVRELVDLVDSITILQDLDSKPLSIDQISPNELIQMALQMTAQRASATGVQVRSLCPPELPPILGDFTRLVQALHQLLDNACKFSPQEGLVTLSAELVSDSLTISIADQGIGVPPAEHQRIFERFYQVDGSISRRYGGTGLGLAIVHDVIQAHGGNIWVESEGIPGEGSVFMITLPIYSEAGHTGPPFNAS